MNNTIRYPDGYYYARSVALRLIKKQNKDIDNSISRSIRISPNNIENYIRRYMLDYATSFPTDKINDMVRMYNESISFFRHKLEIEGPDLDKYDSSNIDKRAKVYTININSIPYNEMNIIDSICKKSIDFVCSEWHFR